MFYSCSYLDRWMCSGRRCCSPLHEALTSTSQQTGIWRPSSTPQQARPPSSHLYPPTRSTLHALDSVTLSPTSLHMERVHLTTATTHPSFPSTGTPPSSPRRRVATEAPRPLDPPAGRRPLPAAGERRPRGAGRTPRPPERLTSKPMRSSKSSPTFFFTTKRPQWQRGPSLAPRGEGDPARPPSPPPSSPGPSRGRL